jgi:hypothetical protein
MQTGVCWLRARGERDIKNSLVKMIENVVTKTFKIKRNS